MNRSFKLQLNKETLKSLSAHEVEQVDGAIYVHTLASVCPCTRNTLVLTRCTTTSFYGAC